MLSKNVVLIETINNTGTGLIYPCHYNSIKNSYIVITNAHVLEGFTSENPDQNYKDELFIHFYDDIGNKIERNEVLEIRVFNKSKHIPEDDIAALLIVLSKNILLTLEKSILDKLIDNREKIYMEGYPGVMLNDDIYQKIQLEGQEKTMFPENKKIGIYQITDDYHWYNNFNDKKLIDGLSGSPVYYVKNEKKYILGISQSVSDINQGENPFKIIYYLKIGYILDFLRKNGCIIYSKITEHEYKIVWIFEQQRDSKNEDITMLMIGSSGAGKSSFAKNFAYSGSKINSTNDGQTTRTKVIYEYSLEPVKSNAIIKILKQEDFVKSMIQKLEFDFFKKYIMNSLELSDENVKNENFFLNNVQAILRIILDIGIEDDDSIEQLINEIWKILRGERNNELRCTVYETVVIEIKNRINQKYLKYIIDEYYLIELFEKTSMNFDIQFEQEELTIIEDLKREYNKSKSINFKAYKNLQTRLVSKARINNSYKANEFSYKYMIENIDELFNVEGYFSIEEFRFTFNKEYDFKKNLLDELSKKGQRKELIDILEEIFKEIHRQLKSCIKSKFDFDDSKEIDILTMNENEQSLISQCLQVTPEGSLTGIIDYVKIEDMISNEYAMIIWELGINKIKLIDTCGLDHVETYNKSSIENKLLENAYDNEKNSNLSFTKTNVLYFKKLDSGKPDELRNILPSISKVMPAAPVYCVFTGIDIFYKTSEEIKSLLWKNENKRNPKAINYILSKIGMDSIIENNKSSSANNMYLTMKNNLLAYCGLKQLEVNDFQIYNSNVKHLKKVLASITMKEYSSLEIIDNFEDEDEFYKEVESAVNKILIELFSKASIHDKYYRWNTKKADISGHKKRKEVGFYCTYRHMINQLFHEAYANVSNDESLINDILIIDKFKDTKNALHSALKNMENSFIGDYHSLTDIKSAKKNEFRRIIEKMYNEGPYDYNPYEEDEMNKKYIRDQDIQVNRDRIFADIFNFEKGLRDSNILNNFAKEFVKCLKLQIDEDNELKSKNMIKLNQEFMERLNELETEFIEKYSNQEDDNREKIKRRFNQLMVYRFKAANRNY